MIKRVLAATAVLVALVVASQALAEVVQSGQLRVHFSGSVTPHTLPRHGTGPIKISVGTKIDVIKGKKPLQLQRLEIAINKNGILDTSGLPICALDEVQPSTTQDAMRNCRRALVGEGIFEAKVLLKGQASFPSRGKMYAFNSRIDGQPAILAHVYGTQPAPASFTLVFKVKRTKGTFGTVLTALLPEVTSESGYVTGLSLTLGKRFTSHGRSHSYVSAGCPAPKGFPGASFPFARATLSFDGGKRVSQVMTRSCGARG